MHILIALHWFFSFPYSFIILIKHFSLFFHLHDTINISFRYSQMQMPLRLRLYFFLLHSVSLPLYKYTHADTNAVTKIILSFVYGWKSLEGFFLFSVKQKNVNNFSKFSIRFFVVVTLTNSILYIFILLFQHHYYHKHSPPMIMAASGNEREMNVWRVCVLVCWRARVCIWVSSYW